MTESLVLPPSRRAWTLEDLQRVPDDGYRYEITDGSLLVTPPAAIPHFRVTTLLRRLLESQAPPTLVVGEGVGTGIDRDPRRTTFRIPDLTVLHRSAMDRDDLALEPADVVLVVEVVSPGNAGYDLITKRHQYGRAGIPHYWIVDPRQRTLTALRHDGRDGYAEVATVGPGTTWQTAEPFPVTLDPADFTRAG